MSGWVHEGGKSLNYGVFKNWKEFFNTDKISKLVVSMFEFGALHVCATFLYGWYFSFFIMMMSSHQGLKKKSWKGLLAWDFGLPIWRQCYNLQPIMYNVDA
jgi:hypothetical protein